MKLMGISGKMGVGKTTVANMIKEFIPGAERVAFGDILKREIAEKYGVPLAYFYEAKNMPVWATPERCAVGWPKNRRSSSMTVRELMQWYGTELVRAENPDYWVHAMRNTLRTMARSGVPVVIIDDVRFPNEAELVRNDGGVLVRIDAYPGYTVPGSVSGHKSETILDAWQDWDIVVRADYGLDNLRKVAELFAKAIKKNFDAEK